MNRENGKIIRNKTLSMCYWMCELQLCDFVATFQNRTGIQNYENFYGRCKLSLCVWCHNTNTCTIPTRKRYRTANTAYGTSYWHVYIYIFIYAHAHQPTIPFDNRSVFKYIKLKELNTCFSVIRGLFSISFEFCFSVL